MVIGTAPALPNLYRCSVCSHLDGGQALLAVALLNTNVDVVLGTGGLSVLFSRIRKRICTRHNIPVTYVCMEKLLSRRDQIHIASKNGG